MNIKWLVFGTAYALCCFAASAAYCGNGTAPSGAASAAGMISEKKLAQVMPGKSTKAQVQSLLGTPWRIVQFNDCGKAMPGQEDETWDYRGKDSSGTYRVHIEFDDGGIAHLVAKIPDQVSGGKGTTAKIAPLEAMKSMQM
jgi:outer membrane protein assembly factor BamE (lipoprotein component of BamABCDE complex)